MEQILRDGSCRTSAVVPADTLEVSVMGSCSMVWVKGAWLFMVLHAAVPKAGLIKVTEDG